MWIFENDYSLAWAAYGVAALGCLLVWFRLTRWMWRGLREPLRVIVAVLLLTPTIVDPGKELFAPAIAITALDLMFKVGDNAWRAVADLALYGLIALALYLVWVAVRWPVERWLRRRRDGRGEVAEDSHTLGERMTAEQEEAQRPMPPQSRRIEPRL